MGSPTPETRALIGTGEARFAWRRSRISNLGVLGDLAVNRFLLNRQDAKSPRRMLTASPQGASVRGKDGFGRRRLGVQALLERAPVRQAGALIEVALVGDLALVDRGRLRHQERARDPRAAVRARRIETLQAL